MWKIKGDSDDPISLSLNEMIFGIPLQLFEAFFFLGERVIHKKNRDSVDEQAIRGEPQLKWFIMVNWWFDIKPHVSRIEKSTFMAGFFASEDLR